MRLRPWASLVYCLLWLVAAPVRAQPLNEDDWRFFKEESYSRFSHDARIETGSQRWEDLFFAASENARSVDDAVRGFARRLNIAPDRARDYAGLIAAVVRQRQDCDDGCSFGPGTPLYERIERYALAEPSGALLTDVVRNLWPHISVDLPRAANLVQITLRHPAASAIFRSAAQYDEDEILVAAAWATLAPDATPQAGLIVNGAYRADGDAWVDAIFQAAEERLVQSGAAPALRARLGHLILARMLRLGLSQAAVERYLAYPQEVRALLPVLPSPAPERRMDDGFCERAALAYGLADDLAAALWLVGREEDARALLRHAPISDVAIGSAARARREALLEAINPARPDPDLFELLFDNPSDEHRRNLELGCRPDLAGGWFSAAGSSSPAHRELVARRFASAGYADVATHLRTMNRSSHVNDRQLARNRQLALLLAPDAEPRREHLASDIAAARPAPTPETAGASPSRLHLAGLSPWWTERPDVSEEPRDSDEDGPDLPHDVSFPVSRDSILRFEERGGEWAILYISNELDLPGEVPAAGLWFARTQGGQWAPPIYLGLQQYFPYAVKARSSVPLLDGNRLRIAAVRQEIEAASITFPPVGLTLSGEAQDVLLEMDLERVAADSDGDGLTDIVERRVGLDYRSRDSDSDGLADGDDPLPLTPRATTDHRSSAAARAIIRQIFRFDAGAITIAPVEAGAPRPLTNAIGEGSRPAVPRRQTLFLVADESLFAGAEAANMRLFVYSPADATALRQGAAPFYPPRIITHLSSLDGMTHYIDWSADWVGGSFILRCSPAGDCRVQDLVSWIT